MALQIKGKDKQVLLQWQQWLDENRGARAKLRRANSPDDILMTKAFFDFLHFHAEVDGQRCCLTNQWRQPENLQTAATLCGLLSKVKSNVKAEQTMTVLDEENQQYKKSKVTLSFSAQLAMPNAGGGSPIMSEVRFARLQKSESVDSFYLNMTRAIAMLNGAVNLDSMIDDILHWCREFEFGADNEPRNRLAVRWATDYFTTLTYNKLA